MFCPHLLLIKEIKLPICKYCAEFWCTTKRLQGTKYPFRPTTVTTTYGQQKRPEIASRPFNSLTVIMTVYLQQFFFTNNACNTFNIPVNIFFIVLIFLFIFYPADDVYAPATA